MSIRVKVDEDLPRQVADLFAERGHDAVTVVMQGWQGLVDDALWPRVQQEQRWLITADKDFADLHIYPLCISIRQAAMRVFSFSGWMKKVGMATWS